MVLGPDRAGKRLFPGVAEKKALRPVDTTTFASGVAVHTFEPVKR